MLHNEKASEARDLPVKQGIYRRVGEHRGGGGNKIPRLVQHSFVLLTTGLLSNVKVTRLDVVAANMAHENSFLSKAVLEVSRRYFVC